MKRIVAALCMCALLLSGTGCSLQTSSGNVSNRMSGAFTSDVTMTTSDSETKAALTRYGTDAWRVVFTEPAALSGVQLDFVDDEVTASYKGLEFSVPQSAQAVRTMLEELMEIVDEMALEPTLEGTEEDGSIVCEGEIDEGDYTLTFAEDGTPLSFSLPCYGLTVTFDTFAENGSAQEPSDTVPEATSPASEAETAAETAAESQ